MNTWEVVLRDTEWKTIGGSTQLEVTRKTELVQADWTSLSGGALVFQTEERGKLTTILALAPGQWITLRLVASV